MRQLRKGHPERQAVIEHGDLGTGGLDLPAPFRMCVAVVTPGQRTPSVREKLTGEGLVGLD